MNNAPSAIPSLTEHNECHFCSQAGAVPGNTHLRCLNPDPAMTGDPHGIRNGWFFYPILFDPVWKTRRCANFEAPANLRAGPA
ncbi:hypothetical protein [Thiomonas sp.]